MSEVMSIEQTMQDRYRSGRERLGMSVTPKPAVVPRSRVTAALAAPKPEFVVSEPIEQTLIRASQNWTTGTYSVSVAQPIDTDDDLAENISVINSRWRDIIKQVSLKHGVSILEIRGRYRDQRIVKARHEVFYRMRMETGFSFPEIGRRVGGFDHSTAINGYRTHMQQIKDGTAL